MKNFFRNAMNFGRAVGHMLSTTFFRVLTLTCIALIMQHVNLDVVLFSHDGGLFAPLANSLWSIVWNPQITIPAIEITLVDLVAVAALGYLFSGVAQLIVFLARCVWALIKKAYTNLVRAFEEIIHACKPLWVKFANWFRQLFTKIKNSKFVYWLKQDDRNNSVISIRK